MAVIKYSVSVVLGVLITLVLLYIMQSLIQSGEKVLKEDTGEHLVEYVRLKDNPQLKIKNRKPKPPPPPDSPPPDLPKPSFITQVDDGGWTMQPVAMETPEGPTGPSLAMGDGEYLPIVQVQPEYPRLALMKGMIGWVIIEFTVTETGTVEEPYVISNCAMVVVAGRDTECEDRPNSIFDTAALRAAKKFKFKPRVINGVAMSTAGVQNKITFELND